MKDTPDPEDSILQMITKKDIVPLKDDFFIITEKFDRAPDPLEQIANHLYEPSYVSFE